jgi:hypothetical protein
MIQVTDHPEDVPEVDKLDKLQTLHSVKTISSGSQQRSINHFNPVIWRWMVGAHSAETFEPLKGRSDNS